MRHPAYRRLFIGQAVSGLGLQFTAVAVPVQMFALTGSSLWVGLLGVAGLVPLVVFALWGGAVADAVDRRVVLLVGSTLMWGSTIVLFGLTAFGMTTPLALLLSTAVQAMGFGVSSATRGAIIPRLIDEGEIPSANALGTTTFNISMTVGPLMAGLLVKDGRFAVAYALDAVAFTVALWAAFRLPTLLPQGSGEEPDRRPTAAARRAAAKAGRRPGRQRATPPATEPRRRWARIGAARGADRSAPGWREVKAGLSYLTQTPVLWLSFAIDIAAMVFALPRALFPEMADERYGPGSLGWLYAAIAIGSVAAGLTSGWIGRVRRQGLALIIAVVVWGLAVAAAGLAPALWLVVLLLAVGGAADLVSAVYRQSILQTYAPDELRGRLQGVFFAVVAGGPRLGDLRAGVTAAVVGPTVAWVGGGIAAAAVAVVLAIAFPALARYPSRLPSR